jgi:hypothetical protein
MHPIDARCFHYFAEIIRTGTSTNSAERVLSLIVDRIVRNCAYCFTSEWPPRGATMPVT